MMFSLIFSILFYKFTKKGGVTVDGIYIFLPVICDTIIITSIIEKL